MRTLASLDDKDVLQLYYAAVGLELPEDYIGMIRREIQLRGIEFQATRPAK